MLSANRTNSTRLRRHVWPPVLLGTGILSLLLVVATPWSGLLAVAVIVAAIVRRTDAATPAQRWMQFGGAGAAVLTLLVLAVVGAAFLLTEA